MPPTRTKKPDPGSNATFPLGFTSSEKQDGDKKGSDRKNGKKPPKRKFLDTYCENLTRKAREGKLDDIIGRDREIYRTIQILSRRQKNNPCLIGEAGVGKTAIAEGIAERIAKGDVPIGLQDKEESICWTSPVWWRAPSSAASLSSGSRACWAR